MTPREIDYVIAQKILGMVCECPHAPRMMCRVHDCALYSQDMGAAWVVAEKLEMFEWARFLEKHEGQWRVVSHNEIDPRVIASAPTAPMAICFAGLKIREEQAGQRKGESDGR